jgi:HSP20 family protein
MMNLTRWNPWRDATTLQHQINRLFDDSMIRAAGADDDFMGTWYPVVDLFEKDDSFVFKAELPGLKKEDISIDLKDRVLTLKGERRYENEVKEENYFRRERSYGKFQRAFRLPAEIDPDKIKAEFKDGLLEIEVPKPEEHKPKAITIH